MRGKRTGWLLATLAILLVGAALAQAKDESPRRDRRVLVFDGGAWLGVQLSDITAEKARELKLPGEYGALIEEVEEDSPAAKAGLQANDVILSFADERVRSVAHLRRLLEETPPGRRVSLQVSRAGQTRPLEVTPEEHRAALALPEIQVGPIEIPQVEVPEFNFRLFTRGPRLGISADELTPQLAEYFGVKQGKGVLIREVMAGSAAAKANLKAGDVIIRVDEEAVGSVSDLRRALDREHPGNEVTLTIVRDRKEQTVKVELDQPEPRAPRRIAGLVSEEWLRTREQFEQALEQERRALEQQRKALEVEKQKLQQQMREVEERLRSRP